MGQAVQALADFLIDERCHACARPAEAATRLAMPADAASAALATPLRVGARRAGIATQPLCRACCHDLVAVHEPIAIGTRRVDGSIALVSGGCVPGVAGTRFARVEPLWVWPAFQTDDRVLSIIHALKFSRRERLAAWLARGLAAGLPGRALRDAGCEMVLVPVPLDRRSLRRRGFNQAQRLAVALGALVGAPVVHDALVKTRVTTPQSSLDGADRVRNVVGAIEVRERSAVAGCAVAVIDDLVTTGATAAACAAALWSAGAARVRVICVGYRP